jgi:DNA-binding MarR family transcriptional regulator
MPIDQIDPLIANPGRLRILAALAAEPRQPFVQLRSVTRLTDGNLSTHARRLQSAGLIAIEKQFSAGKPQTTLALTPHGRRALEAHVAHLTAALRPPEAQVPSVADVADHVDEWID